MISNKEKVVIERRNGVTIYGKVIDNKGRLGQFSVYSDYLGDNGAVYTLLSDAQIRMKALIGAKDK